jgi:hypothetical protein
LFSKLSGLLHHKQCNLITLHAGAASTSLTELKQGLDRIEQHLTAKPVLKFDFSESKAGKSEAVTSVLAAFGLASFTPIKPEMLPKFSRKLMRSQYVPFALWGIAPDEVKSSAALCNHFREQLAAFGEPMVNGRFSLYDVRNQNDLGFALATPGGQLVFNGGTDAVIVPSGQKIWWNRQLRVIIDWKTPQELQALAYIRTTKQGILELVGGLANSEHPALVVFTDGINFVILQPYNISIRYLHTLSPSTQSVLPEEGFTDINTAFRFIVHHLQTVSSADPAFTEQTADVSTELEHVLRPLKRVKGALGVGEGLAEQLAGCKALPEEYRLDAISDTIKAWRMSYFS